ncbi:B-cell CLL/lymphoma 9 protein-like isoform X6 [Penaeus japonicus]|uniref:B-cell CLL/lymphoma 9 protein-like isoform X6 n=1 Tax=Penaeus japonicus TaxID=27405 RepID=UPI001C70E102|nr:B-cell CLL/lymphoma 9 protein-like isoform X6 [Penaeus japonicus]
MIQGRVLRRRLRRGPGLPLPLGPQRQPLWPARTSAGRLRHHGRLLQAVCAPSGAHDAQPLQGGLRQGSEWVWSHQGHVRGLGPRGAPRLHPRPGGSSRLPSGPQHVPPGPGSTRGRLEHVRDDARVPAPPAIPAAASADQQPDEPAGLQHHLLPLDGHCSSEFLPLDCWSQRAKAPGTSDLHAVPDSRTGEGVPHKPLLNPPKKNRDGARPVPDRATDQDMVPEPEDEAEEGDPGD